MYTVSESNLLLNLRYNSLRRLCGKGGAGNVIFEVAVPPLSIPIRAIIRRAQIGHIEQLRIRQLEHGVTRLVVKFVHFVAVCGVIRNAVVLRHTHTTLEQVARGGAGVHGELAGGDDLEAAVGGELGALGKALDAIHAVGEVVRAFWGHLQLGRQSAIAEHEGRGLGAPGLEVVLGVLDENICMKCVSKRV